MIQKQLPNRFNGQIMEFAFHRFWKVLIRLKTWMGHSIHERIHLVTKRNMILKEQSNWERALEIFEWFKGKGCCELQVIHITLCSGFLGELENGAMLNVCAMI